ncbi:MAG TPA: 5-carboxymethyl-2-hydroxymuconate Delta-isomerase [Trinickia sp.]|uniref:5-carboxymethyl-2-hydroxymuconate Delta-isomerase n=1 Tax=Trinickia sp. TaxID=2571163 RepID=UPI002C3FCE8D|nr:5-carboxymethyl-2-hydroxymuconate Delta-isomerase [Trinickia sp.]HVW49992.1 5-carboxymethyl-2-hydroxymuconate Delta-isomerase [Trinickia sp.]
MPHLTLEYSAGLSDEDGMALLCRKLALSLHEQKEGDRPVYPLGGIRVRALRCDAYCIADGLTDAAFLHAYLRIATGRSEAVKKATGDALFDIIKQHFAWTFEARGLALSLEINEIGEAGAWRHNNLHARLKR